MTKTIQSKRDKYLLKRYGIDESEYQTMLSHQKGKCKICGKEPTGRPLHVDHDHSLSYYKLTAYKEPHEWYAETDSDISPFPGFFSRKPTKSAAIQDVRLQLKKASVRGLICFHCNTTLKWARDNPEILRSAAKYLENYQQKLIHYGGQSA